MEPLSSEAVRLELFGLARTPDLADFPCRISHLVNKVSPAFGVTADSLIQNHTILPFFRPFFGSELVTRIAGELLHLPSENYISRLRGASAQPEFLRYCPVCVEHDRRSYKEAYWHRLHQLGVVHVCPIHKVLLQNSSVKRAVTTTYHSSAPKMLSLPG